MAIFKTKDKSGNLICNFMVTSGLEFSENTAIEMTQNDAEQRVEFKKRMSKEESFYLAYSKITNCGDITEEEVKKVGNKAISRGAVGGLLLGPVGAVVGGISGSGKDKTKSTYRHFFIINYVSKGIEKVIMLQIVGASLKWKKFIDTLKTKIPQKTVSREL